MFGKGSINSFGKWDLWSMHPIKAKNPLKFNSIPRMHIRKKKKPHLNINVIDNAFQKTNIIKIMMMWGIIKYKINVKLLSSWQGYNNSYGDGNYDLYMHINKCFGELYQYP